MADMKRALQCGGCGKIQKFILCNCPGAKVKRGFRLRKPPIFARKGIMGSGGPDWWRNDYEFCPFVTKWGVTRLPFGDPTAIGHPPLYPPGGAPSHRKKDDSRVKGNYKPPALANPGNIRSHAVGGGHMGDNAAHKGEAPFPEGLARDFVLCFCPEGGTVYDPFIGTGTTAVVAAQHGRNFIGSDCRANQISMTRERLLSKGITNVQDS